MPCLACRYWVNKYGHATAHTTDAANTCVSLKTPTVPIMLCDPTKAYYCVYSECVSQGTWPLPALAPGRGDLVKEDGIGSTATTACVCMCAQRDAMFPVACALPASPPIRGVPQDVELSVGAPLGQLLNNPGGVT